jgi:hypothetical protein
MRSAQQAAASAGIRIFAQRIKREKHNNNPSLSEKFPDIFLSNSYFYYFEI